MAFLDFGNTASSGAADELRRSACWPRSTATPPRFAAAPELGYVRDLDGSTSEVLLTQARRDRRLVPAGP